MSTASIPVESEQAIGRITLDASAEVLRIEDLRIVNPGVVSYFNALPPDRWEEELHRAVDVGIAVIDKIEVVTDLSFVENRVGRLMDGVEAGLDRMAACVMEQIDARFDPGQEGSHSAKVGNLIDGKKTELVTTLHRIVDDFRRDEERIRRELDNSFDPDRKGSYLARLQAELASFERRISETFDEKRTDSVPALFKVSLDQAFGEDGQLAVILRNHLSLSREGGPLAKIHREIAAVREEIAAQRAAEEVLQKSPLKGFTFEKRVEATLQGTASVFAGDWVEDVRNVGSRKGDFLYHLAEGLVIGIEARDRPITSAAKTRQDLDVILRERSADYAIYVVASPEQLQRQVGDWDEFEGNKAVTSIELLGLSLKFARLRLRTRTDAHSVDLHAILERVRSIKDALKKMGRIKAEARKSERASQSVICFAEELEDSIRGTLTALEDALNRSDDDCSVDGGGEMPDGI